MMAAVDRPEDHSAVEEVLWGETAYNERYRFSMPKSFDVIQGAEICRAPVELKAFKGKWLRVSVSGFGKILKFEV